MGAVEEKDFSNSGAGATEYMCSAMDGGYDSMQNTTKFPDTEGSMDDGPLGTFYHEPTGGSRDDGDAGSY